MEIRQLFKPTPHLARVDEALSRRRSEGRGGLKGVLEGPEGDPSQEMAASQLSTLRVPRTTGGVAWGSRQQICSFS